MYNRIRDPVDIEPIVAPVPENTISNLHFLYLDPPLSSGLPAVRLPAEYVAPAIPTLYHRLL